MQKILLVAMPTWETGFPFYALAQVGAIVKQAGWNYDVLDLNIRTYNIAAIEDKQKWNWWGLQDRDPAYYEPLWNSYKEFIKKELRTKLEQNDYNLIGFSLNILTRYFSIKSAEFVKEIKPGIPVIFGGPECFPLESGLKLLTDYEFCPDYILQGEGEIALVEFLKEFEFNETTETKTKGFAYKKAGKVIDLGEPELPDFRKNNVIADYSRIDLKEYKTEGRFSSYLSRGCINECSFCNEKFNFRRYRPRMPEDAFNEIKEMIKLAPQVERPIISFKDSILNGHLKYFEKFLDLIIESGTKINWTGQLSFSRPFGREIMEKCKKSGALYLFWGLESASQYIQDIMGKNSNQLDVERILDISNEIGLQSQIALLVGFPGEQSSHIMETVLFILKYRVTEYVSFPYVATIEIVPNSILSNEPEKYNIEDRNKHTWFTKDGKNNIDVRNFRKFYLSNVCWNKDFSFENCSELNTLKLINFNDYSVASEIASEILELYSQCDREDDARNFLLNWNAGEDWISNGEHLEYWQPSLAPKKLFFENWFFGEKNSWENKKRIIEFIFNGLKQLNTKVLNEIDVDSISANKNITERFF